MREPKEMPLSSILLSVDETADLLGLGRTQTYELVMSGKISSVKSVDVVSWSAMVFKNLLVNFSEHKTHLRANRRSTASRPLPEQLPADRDRGGDRKHLQSCESTSDPRLD